MLNRKIIFFQPAYAHYRKELFKILKKKYSLHFVFEKSKGKYPGFSKPEGLNCIFIDKNFKNSNLGIVFYLLKLRPDIIISSVSNSNRSIFAFLYSKIFRKKFILWILEWKKTEYRGNVIKVFFKRLKRLIGTELILQSDALIVGSTAARDYAISLGRKKFFLALQCSDDLRKFAANFSINSRYKKITFLYLGRIVEWKGLKILIKAYHLLRCKYKNVALLIGGEGPEKNECMLLVKSLGADDIKFIGPVDHSNTWNIYQRGDVFILPSYEIKDDYEVWGLTVNEAMSMCLPIITTTRVGAAFDMVVDNYNGFIVQDNDVIELFQAMEKIIKCDLFQMGMNSRYIFEKNNNYSEMANGFIKAIESFK